MPLQLGGPETDRGQSVVFDPLNDLEVRQALQTRRDLEDQGFRTVEEREGLIRLEPPPRAETLCLFRVISQNGDDRLVWDRTDPAQVREAAQTFADYIKRGYTAYAVLEDGTRGMTVEVFDPFDEDLVFRSSHQTMVLVPPTRPG